MSRPNSETNGQSEPEGVNAVYRRGDLLRAAANPDTDMVVLMASMEEHIAHGRNLMMVGCQFRALIGQRKATVLTCTAHELALENGSRIAISSKVSGADEIRTVELEVNVIDPTNHYSNPNMILLDRATRRELGMNDPVTDVQVARGLVEVERL